jgi:hypothetical protein
MQIFFHLKLGAAASINIRRGLGYCGLSGGFQDQNHNGFFDNE